LEKKYAHPPGAGWEGLGGVQEEKGFVKPEREKKSHKRTRGGGTW